MRRAPMLLAPMLALAALVAAPGLAREEIPAETRERGWTGKLPTCDDGWVLGRIQSKFASTERRFWNSSAEIVGFDKVRQAAFRPHGLDLIHRRYCQATAIMHDRRRLVVRYAVIEDAGIVGLTNEVQFCLDGYDRNYTAMPGCYRLDR